jgi:hypothetical protein
LDDYFHFLEASEVSTAETFGRFCQQRMGLPYPTTKNLVILKRQAKAFFKENPNTDWQTLVRTFDWCVNHNRRYAEAYGVFNAVKYAWRDGYLPELNPTPPSDSKLEHRIESALKVEDDEQWRYRLLASVGIDARRRVYDAWRQERGVRGGS